MKKKEKNFRKNKRLFKINIFILKPIQVQIMKKMILGLKRLIRMIQKNKKKVQM